MAGCFSSSAFNLNGCGKIEAKGANPILPVAREVLKAISLMLQGGIEPPVSLGQHECGNKSGLCPQVLIQGHNSNSDIWLSLLKSVHNLDGVVGPVD